MFSLFVHVITVSFDIICTEATERYPMKVEDDGATGFHFSHNFIFPHSPMRPIPRGPKDLLIVNFSTLAG
jgi:hypothetical protein